MTPLVRIGGTAAALGATLTLALGGVAGARPGDATMQQIYPLASGLCAKVAAGTEKPRLKPFATQLTADCAALQKEFTEATTGVVTVRAAVLPALAADRAAVHAVCPKPVTPVPAACRLAHTQNDAAIRSLAAQWKAAVHNYFATLVAARAKFWAAVKSLPGEKHAVTDKPLPVPPR